MAKQYDKEFKQDAVNYRFDHRELTVKQCAENLGVPLQRLAFGSQE